MGVCSRCSVAIRALGPQGWRNNENPRSKFVTTLPKYQVTQVLDCWICTRLSEWLEIQDETSSLKWRNEGLEVEYSVHQRLTLEGVSREDGLPPLSILMNPTGHKEENACYIELNFVSSQVHLAASSRRPSSSLVDLELIEKWFRRCSTDHERCRRNDRAWYPTRLLHLGSQASDVRIVITKDDPPDGPYMTLSHRWSNESYKRLESSTMPQLQKAVNVISLPQVFQDAIRIARHLDVHYLWIDSLCIKQDENDLTDWMQESKMMGQVYSSACLNISATWPTESGDRLLGCSSWASRLPSEIKIDFENQSYSYFVVDGCLWRDEVDDGPLNDRGWVFQERYLAKRVVHFGQSQLAWECEEWRALGMFPDGLPFYLGEPESKPGRDAAMTASIPQSRQLQEHHMGFAEDWQQLVSKYSRCKFSFPHDKLTAFEGIARCIMETTPEDAYLAGSWKSTALYDLPWYRHEDDRVSFPIQKTRGRAPSWSWASVDGEINFPLVTNPFPKVMLRYAEVKSLVGQTKLTSNAVVVGGTIHIEGYCLPLTLRRSENNGIIGFSLAGFQFSTTKGRLRSTIYLECYEDISCPPLYPRNIFFLPLFCMTHSLYGIVLQKVRGIGEYRRIGAVNVTLMATTNGSLDERGEEIISQRRAQPQAAVLPSEFGQVQDIWSKPAVDLVAYLGKPRRHFRRINIS
ncbi:heterokaryon incompatibility protein-domain-containing protein [Diaporthe sp. PMI_573]|nr:heterokaryon incompatibility protein-domain-containing protein [Diaporthaceae sp. PMI_573]